MAFARGSACNSHLKAIAQHPKLLLIFLVTNHFQAADELQRLVVLGDDADVLLVVRARRVPASDAQRSLQAEEQVAVAVHRLRRCLRGAEADFVEFARRTVGAGRPHRPIVEHTQAHRVLRVAGERMEI